MISFIIEFFCDQNMRRYFYLLPLIFKCKNASPVFLKITGHVFYVPLLMWWSFQLLLVFEFF